MGYIGYLGFAAQVPWTMLLIYLPVLETVLGGSTFSYAVSIAMGLACNLIRLCVVVYGRRFTFRLRVLTGAVFSALFTAGYLVIYICSTPEEDTDTNTALHSLWFWLGLGLALLGGAGNAQLMSTGYGVASLVSVDRPVSNTLFFFGQAVASAACWPLKRLVESLTGSLSVQLGSLMGTISVVSLTVIPVYLLRISRYSRLVAPHSETTSLKWTDVKRILRTTIYPILCLWVTYLCTNMVTPGQLMQWSAPVGEESALLSDPKLYRSLCSYVHLLSDAVSKSVPVLLAVDRKRMHRILASRATPVVMGVLVLLRLCLVPLFYDPPGSTTGRFILLAIFGAMNGSAASLAISLCSYRTDPADTDVAGYLSSFAIINGLFVGSLGGMLVRFATTS